jgi:hypothetical protein
MNFEMLKTLKNAMKGFTKTMMQLLQCSTFLNFVLSWMKGK